MDRMNLKLDIQAGSKVQPFRTIEDVWEPAAVNVPQYRMEKAGANVPGCFDHS